MAKILIIDDDDQLRISFSKLLTEENYDVVSAASGEAGVEIVNTTPLDLVILDVRLPGMNGLETFKEIKKIDGTLPTIIVTAFGTTDTAIEATKAGAFDYLLKPFDIPEMLNLITQAIDAGYCMRTPVHVGAEPSTYSPDAIVGQSPGMQKVYKTIGRVAQTDATVLIQGESGTGKELVARAVYQHGIRSDKNFSIINCVAIPENLLESELFGFEKGAFTGATRRHIGKIEQANGGTVFLDEIGDMPISIQAKILRLLQERCIERLGGDETIPVDVRIIAATNRDLKSAIAQGLFREDLYFRLKVVTIELPPLRDRIEDIQPLTAHYLERFSHELKIDNPGIREEALDLLKKYEWPGNIRELANLIHKALIFNRGNPLSLSDLSQIIRKQETPGEISQDSTQEETIRQWVHACLSHPSNDHSFEFFSDTICAMAVEEALKISNGNRSQAARLLDISRPTLHAKIDKYGINTISSTQIIR
ncbi:sigma-54 dependent transcriptional regulator [Desulfobacter sp.]|uniref:sigma-54-dependent transcriptional regulator n=1 Tax=Desulfobacter sp. TaxID=2294 RepID=UPI000E9094EB|nr:sigma-54 dependent transcriptional regulator [Desulfobacter sp.]MBP8828117.1 sigma-54-dependent Fis family transcriptional regulator [Desulfobacter sp.]HBT89006.1 Fis family transcriptional regulator [Desulfobacter sp.]